MTSISFVNVTCVLCSKTSMQECVDSTNAFGSFDLDTRPPQMKRSTINTWVERCPNCGYCSFDISKDIEGSQEVIKSKKYIDQLKNMNNPALANEFLCYSLIKEQNRDYSDAGWACVNAAWACDDDDAEDSAKKCRERAIILFKKARESNDKFAKQAGAEEALLIDLHRRSGQFESAVNFLNEALAKNPNELIEKVVHFQAVLIAEKDITCHTIQEALE